MIDPTVEELSEEVRELKTMVHDLKVWREQAIEMEESRDRLARLYNAAWDECLEWRENSGRFAQGAWWHGEKYAHAANEHDHSRSREGKA